jgi:hypothetical protein
LIAIVLGAVAILLELVFRNFLLLSYELFFYIPSANSAKKNEVALKPNPAAGAGAWDEGHAQLDGGDTTSPDPSTPSKQEVTVL